MPSSSVKTPSMPASCGKRLSSRARIAAMAAARAFRRRRLRAAHTARPRRSMPPMQPEATLYT